jgi:hypothetical protein
MIMPSTHPFERGSWPLVIHEALMEMIPLCLSAKGRGKRVEVELMADRSYRRYLNRQANLTKMFVKTVSSIEGLEIITKKCAVEGFWLGEYGRFLESGTFDPSEKNTHCVIHN